MKKLLALFLLLALLIPMCVVAQAESAEEVEKKPFFNINMATVSPTNVDVFDELKYTYDQPFFWALPVDKDNIEVVVQAFGSTDIYVQARELKDRLDARPEGARYMLFGLPQRMFKNAMESYVFFEKSVELTKTWWVDFLKEYKECGGKLDGVVIDIEYEDLANYFLWARIYKTDAFCYNKIEQHPTYQNVIRPLLVERGFKFYEPVTNMTPELYAIHPQSGDQYATSRSIWDAVMRSYVNKCANEAVYEPLLEYYPGAALNDFQSRTTYAWHQEHEFHIVGPAGGNITETVGSANNENTYQTRPAAAFFSSGGKPVYKTPTGYNNAYFENKPFNMLMWDANIFKTAAASSANGKISAWIANFRYNMHEGSTSNTPYYAETLFHIGLLDPEPFLGYILPDEVESTYEEIDENTPDDMYGHALLVTDDIMAELTRVVGTADRKPIPTPDDWNSKFVLSGMYSAGKNYWRLTPDTSIVSLENFKVSGTTDPTFYIEGKTITFPGGKIIEDGNVRDIGTCGYWIETAADVSPVITVEEDFYYKYPAYAEDFEQYEKNTELLTGNTLPINTWTVKKGKQSGGIIMADGDNKVLEMKGTYSISNVILPSNITAIETYPKHHAFEVEVTVPSDMAADAEIVLFNLVGQKSKTKDVGMKIAGGKLYYDNAGEYVELNGVSISGGTKYRVVRELNLSVQDAYTSDYYIYDASGALVGSAEDIPMTELVVPITNITMSCANIVGENVVLDNYKMYLTDVNVNFQLYDANHGMQITGDDMKVARERDTAYRLSWVNATQEEKTYSVVAAYYNGDSLVSEQVIKEVKMAPNTDGVLTDIVRNENAGQTILIYLKDTNSGSKGFGGLKVGSINMNLPLIVLILLALIAMDLIVYAVVFLNKGQKKR